MFLLGPTNGLKHGRPLRFVIIVLVAVLIGMLLLTLPGRTSHSEITARLDRRVPYLTPGEFVAFGSLLIPAGILQALRRRRGKPTPTVVTAEITRVLVAAAIVAVVGVVFVPA